MKLSPNSHEKRRLTVNPSMTEARIPPRKSILLLLVFKLAKVNDPKIIVVYTKAFTIMAGSMSAASSMRGFKLAPEIEVIPKNQRNLVP